MERTYSVHFLGCKTNQSDALSYAGVLQRAGWKEAGKHSSPSLVLVQTCTVTMSADAQGRRLARRLRRENPDAKILLTGCYAQRAEKELSSMPEVDYVIGNLNPRKWEILSEIANRSIAPQYPDFPMSGEITRTRPYIKIQEGCDAHCSYCIIPEVRGKSRSLPEDEIVRRVEYYRDRGYQEMILTGISMGAYGKDLHPRSSLAALMKRIECVPGDFRIRLSSVEPEEIGDEFVDIFTGSPRYQPHLHLPLQSASDQVLKKMRRQYLLRHYDRVVTRLMNRNPDTNLGTDLLAGFPSEDKDAFAETLEYVRNAPFGYCHVFPFSPRPGTPAAEYAKAVMDSEVSERAAKLRALGHEKNLQYRRRYEGTRRRAIVLRGTHEALTDNYIRVKINAVPARDVNVVYIDRVSLESTYGTVVP